MSTDNFAGESGRPNQLLLVCGAIGLSFVVQSMLMLAVPLLALELGASVAIVGLLVSLPFWLPAIVAIPIGSIVGSFGARRTMLVGGIGMLIAPWITVLIPSTLGLVLTQVLLGVSHVTVGIAAQTTVATVGRRLSLERSFGWYATSASSGQFVGPMLAGLTIDNLGGVTVFGVAGSIAVMAVLLAAILPNSTRGHMSPRSLSTVYRTQLQLMRRNAGMQMVLIVTVSTLFGFAAYTAFFPVYLTGLSVSAAHIGLLMGVHALCSTAVRPFMPNLVRMLGGRSRTILASIFVTALTLASIGFTEDLGVLVLVAGCLGVSFGVAQPLTMVAVADHVEEDDRAAAYGFRTTSNQIAQVLAPLALGTLGLFVGLPAMFVSAGLALVAVGCVVLWLRPRFDALEATRRSFGT